MGDTVVKGDIGVAMVTADLLRQGFEVLEPICAVSPFDLVAYRAGQFSRIQVKYREAKNGKIEAMLRRSIIRDGKARHTRLTEEDVDYLAMYCPGTNECYYVKRAECGGSCTLRIEESLNKQALGIRYAKDYRTFVG